jgi:hypothetical protein
MVFGIELQITWIWTVGLSGVKITRLKSLRHHFVFELIEFWGEAGGAST